MNNEQQYISTKKTRKILGVTTKTLVNWDKTGKIDTIRSASGVRLYRLKDIQNILDCNSSFTTKKKIAYCRVSSSKQKDDLKRQTNFFRVNYPDYDLVTDIGSGTNWKRKGLQTILDLAMRANISEVVVAHRDRLCRFGFELIVIYWIINNFD
jgi:predicted site-specific integrase-resolvase